MKEIRPIVLFVDDEELARRTFIRMVERDFRVLVAEDVDQAIKVLEENHKEIGVLLTDQRMPGRLGVDLLEHCRKNYPDIVRMLTTAYSELNDAVAAVNRGEIMRYIEKPWGNIDGILIDLKLAATLYEIKQENQQLVDEKLSVGFRTSQFEKIRTLITVAACQGHTHAISAVESLLRQIAEVPACYQLPEINDLRNYQMFGQPLNNTINAIELGETSAKNSIASPLDEAIFDTLAKQIMVDGVQVSIADSSTMSAVSANGSNCIKNWLGSYDVSNHSIESVSALLQLFICALESNAFVQLGINQDGYLMSIEVKQDQSNMEAIKDSPKSYDWIDDIMILFS